MKSSRALAFQLLIFFIPALLFVSLEGCQSREHGDMVSMESGGSEASQKNVDNRIKSPPGSSIKVAFIEGSVTKKLDPGYTLTIELKPTDPSSRKSPPPVDVGRHIANPNPSPNPDRSIVLINVYHSGPRPNVVVQKMQDPKDFKPSKEFTIVVNMPEDYLLLKGHVECSY